MPILNLQLNGLGTRESEAAQRWSKIKEVLKPVEVEEALKPQLSSSRLNSLRRSVDTTSCVTEERSITTVNDEQLLSFWDDLTMPIPPAYQPISGPHFSHTGNEYEARTSANGGLISQDNYESPALNLNFDEGFEEECSHVSLMIDKVPKDFTAEQTEALKATIIEEQKELNAHILRRESDVVLKEQLAAKRILESEALARKRVNIEKVKCRLAMDEKERKISRDFIRAREDLELGIKKQAATIRQLYGGISTAGSSLMRQYRVQSTHAPQPVELRIHMLRAVKSKLSKGKYVLMVTQYESLGGRPIGWSKVSEYGESHLNTLRAGDIADFVLFMFQYVFITQDLPTVYSCDIIICYAIPCMLLRSVNLSNILI